MEKQEKRKKQKEEQSEISKNNPREYILKRLQENIGNASYSIEDLANELFISKGHLSKTIKNYFGKTFTEFLTELRIERAKQILTDQSTLGIKIYEVAELVGFSNQHYFSTVFKKQTGLSPFDYGKREKK